MARMLNLEDWDAARIAASDTIRHGRERDRLMAELAARYTDGLLALDLDGIRRGLGAARSKWFLPQMLGYGKVKKLVQPVCRGSVPKIDGLLADLDMALSLRSEKEELVKGSGRVREWLGPHWRDGEVSWGALDAAISHCDLLRASIFKTCRVAGKDPAAVRASVADLLTAQPDRFAHEGDLQIKLAAASRSATAAREKLVMARRPLSEKCTAHWDDASVSDVTAEIKLWKASHQHLVELKAASREGAMPSYHDLPALLDSALYLNRLHAEFGAMAEQAGRLLGKEWNGGEADWDRIDRAIERCKLIRQDAQRIAPGAGDSVIERWASFVDRPTEEQKAIVAALDGYVAAYDDHFRALQDIERSLQKDPSQAWGAPDRTGFVENVGEMIARLQDGVPEFKAWCHWRAVRREGATMGMGPLAERFEAADVDADELVEVFRKSFYHEWAEKEIASDPVLNRFFSPDFEKKIRDFRALDKRFQELTVAETRARLASRLPSTTGNENGNSELGILKREMEKQRRHMAIRALIRKIPNLLPRLKPCWLMSPISVTQYLDAAYPPFDLVVFDEASQMPVSGCGGRHRPGDRSDRGRRPEAAAAQQLLQQDRRGRHGRNGR